MTFSNAKFIHDVLNTGYGALTENALPCSLKLARRVRFPQQGQQVGRSIFDSHFLLIIINLRKIDSVPLNACCYDIMPTSH